jgi:hypothetical protein
MEVEMPDQNLLPPGPGRLTGGVAFDVFVRPSGFVAVDEAQLRAIQRRHRRRLIGQGVAWVGRRVTNRRAGLLVAALALASAAIWPAPLRSGSLADAAAVSFEACPV